MSFVFAGLILFAVAAGVANGRLEQVSAAAMEECGQAVKLVLSLAGMMCLWSGLMRVAQRAGLTELLGKCLAPVMRRLFRGLDPQSPAAHAITMNIAANLLGLGNAATPLGLQAMCELEKQNKGRHTASDHMVTFVVLNTASLQLIPATTAALRMQAGCGTPFDLLPAVWISSGAALCCALLTARLLRPGEQRKDVYQARTRSHPGGGGRQ